MTLTKLDKPKEKSIPKSNKFILLAKGVKFNNAEIDITITLTAKYNVITDKKALITKNNLLFLYSSPILFNIFSLTHPFHNLTLNYMERLLFLKRISSLRKTRFQYNCYTLSFKTLESFTSSLLESFLNSFQILLSFHYLKLLFRIEP